MVTGPLSGLSVQGGVHPAPPGAFGGGVLARPWLLGGRTAAPAGPVGVTPVPFSHCCAWCLGLMLTFLSLPLFLLPHLHVSAALSRSASGLRRVGELCK